MTSEEHKALTHILSQPRYTHSTLLEHFMEDVEVVKEAKGTRTSSQNRALHLDCALIAHKLTDSGLDMRQVLKPSYSLPWTPESVKEHIWKPIMKALYGYESTRDLKKTGEIEHIHNVIMRELGEKHGIEDHTFPNDPKKAEEALSGYKLAKHEYEYPPEPEDITVKF